MENFEKIAVYEVPTEYEESVAKIKEISLDLAEQAINSDGPILNPVIEFQKFLANELKEKFLTLNLDDYAAFHFIKGSSPNPKKVTAFDVDDDLIFETYKKFAESKFSTTLSAQ